MNRTRVRVTVRLKPALLDPQGRAVEATLHRMGHEGVTNLRVGKIVEFDVAGDPRQAHAEAASMVEALLANPVMEDATIEVEPNDDEPSSRHDDAPPEQASS